MGLFNVDKLMAGNIAQLRIEKEFFSSLTSHPGEVGRLNETHLVRMLRRYLPAKFGIGTGFLVSGGEHGTMSPQCDIIIYDALNNAPFYFSEAWQIYPIEMVYGVIEVKTSIKRDNLKSAFTNCLSIRNMCRSPNGEPNKKYLRQLPAELKMSVRYDRRSSDLPPRFFVFGYEGPTEATALAKMFQDITKKVEHAHVHGLCVLDQDSGLFLEHEAYRKPEQRVSAIKENGLWHFLMELPKRLSSMLPVVPLKVETEGSSIPRPDTYLYRRDTFEQVDLEHYSSFASWQTFSPGDSPAWNPSGARWNYGHADDDRAPIAGLSCVKRYSQPARLNRM